MTICLKHHAIAKYQSQYANSGIDMLSRPKKYSGTLPAAQLLMISHPLQPEPTLRMS
jgi:hypothetical protein